LERRLEMCGRTGEFESASLRDASLSLFFAAVLVLMREMKG